MHQGFTLDLRKSLDSPSSSGKAPAGNGSAGGSEKPAPVNQDPTANSSEGKSGDSRLFESKTVVKVKLADKQADPNSPLYSVKKFEELGLKPELLKGIYDLKFVKPSKIQERALPLLLKDPPTNLIGQSQSGTGKTAAFALTILSRIDLSQNVPQALCMAPSRELVRQNYDVIREMGKYTSAKALLVVKEGTIRQQAVANSHIIVGTPGTVFNLVRHNLRLFEKVRVFVLDEADNMLGPHGQGLGQQTLRIRSFVPKACQFVLFSATFPENIRRFASKFAPDANELLLEAEEVTVKEIKQFFIRTEPAKKLEILSLLYDLLSLSQSVIFVQRRATADMVMRMMTEKGNSVVSLHGECTPVERDRIMDDFRDGKVKVLVSTNVIARGIDVAQVSMVVNYDMPVDLVGMADTETYIHRIGRTGRFGRTGISVNLIDSEESMQVQRTIELEQGVKITEVPVDDWEQMENMLKSAMQ